MVNEEREKKYLSLLHQEIAMALGCTEPAAAALTGAYAADILKETVEAATIKVSQYILKNGMNVGIPGTEMSGLLIASALGIVSAQPEKELMVLSNISKEDKNVAYKMVEKKAVRIELADTNEKIYIEARVRSKKHTACAIIAGSHKNLCFLQRDDVVLYQKNDSDIEHKRVEDDEEYTVTMKEIFEFTQNIQIEKLYFLKEILKINREIALEGINGEYGLKVGKSILYGNENRLIGLDVANYAVAMTAAAADARMAGCEMPVFSAAGSGNQGLTATVPVVAVGEKLHIAEENILKAAALSVLLTIHTKHYLGRLSVLCGCSISAAIGVVCGVVFMLGGSYEQMCKAISTMVADISGVVCDGAKAGCALKVATAVDSAMRAANMAMCGIGANSKDGIVCQDVEKTLKNLGTLGDCGMRAANPVILEMMLQKQKEQ